MTHPTRTEINASILANCPPEKREELLKKWPWLAKTVKRSQEKPQVAGKKKRNNQPEQELQIACVKLLRTLPGTLFFSVPNHLHLGGKMTGAKMGYMAKQKMMGLLAGASDLVIIFRNHSGQTTVCLPELKTFSNFLSDNQQAFSDKANALGCYTGIVRSLDELTSMLRVAGHMSFK